MRLLKWIFDIGKRHRREILSYEKGKASGRITAIVIMLLFSAGSIVLELTAFKCFENSFGWGLLCSIFAIAFGVTTSETAGVYAYCGFKYYILGSVGKLASRVAKNKGNDFISSEIQEETNKRCHKTVDLIVGILGVVIAVGIIVAMVWILIGRLNFLIQNA